MALSDLMHHPSTAYQALRAECKSSTISNTGDRLLPRSEERERFNAKALYIAAGADEDGGH